MVKLSIVDLDQDNVILNTKVTVGKSYSSRGWALSRIDIHDWIPVEEFERDCKVIIGDICSDAILRFNPRLFYESSDLSFYLKELYDKGCSRHKIPMKIKIRKDNFFTNVPYIEKYFEIETIDTELKVGKSFSSKGWQLSKEVVSCLFPTEHYDGEYLIEINDISSNAKLNLQFRLFYKSTRLSEYLEELHYDNPNQKVSARIIFEHDFTDNQPEEVMDDMRDIKDLNLPKGLNSCSICGKEYSVDEKWVDEYIKFPNTCPECLGKIIALDAFNKIKKSSFSKFTKKELVEATFDSNIDMIWDLLIEYDFLIPFGNLFKLNGNDLIEKDYSKYLSNNLGDKSTSRKRNRDKILELINESEDEKEVCATCGVILTESETDKCESCNDKLLATEYLANIVTKVPYGNSFSKLDLTDLGIDGLKAELMLDKLIKYGLIVSESDVFYKLNEVSFLNEFVDKYSDSPYELQINYVNNFSDVLRISKDDLSSEEKIDALVKWKNFGDFIAFKKGQYGFVSVQFKQDGAFMYSKGYGTSYEAKVDAIYYLKSLGKITLVTDDEIKLEFK